MPQASQTLCKFYLEGTCRHGNNCWYSHDAGRQNPLQGSVFGNATRFGASQPNYAWDSKSSGTAASNTNNQVMKTAFEYLKLIMQETGQWEKSKQWPFSVYSYRKEGSNLDGFEDTSPEEIRVEAYNAIKTRQLENHKQLVAQKFLEWQNKLRQLSNPSEDMKNKLLQQITASLTTSAPATSPTGSTPPLVFGGGAQSPTAPVFGGSTQFGRAPAAAASPFGTNVQTSPPQFGLAANIEPSASSRFGAASPASPFGSSAAPGSTSPFGSAGLGQGAVPFGSPNNAAHSSPFGAAQTSTFGQTSSPFGSHTGTAAQANSPFAPAPAAQQPHPGSVVAPAPGTSSVFGNTASQQQLQSSAGSPCTGGSVFGNVQPNQQSSVFGGAQPILPGSAPSAPQAGAMLFGKAPPAVVPPTPTLAAGPDSLYTPASELTPEELDAFRTGNFELGKIPERPPPRELCRPVTGDVFA